MGWPILAALLGGGIALGIEIDQAKREVREVKRDIEEARRQWELMRTPALCIET